MPGNGALPGPLSGGGSSVRPTDRSRAANVAAGCPRWWGAAYVTVGST